MVNIGILKNTLEQMASDADDKGEKDFGLRMTVEDAFALCKLEQVLRCKDCKHWGKHDDTEVPWETDDAKACEYAIWMVGKNGYCVYGERKDNGTD